MNIHYDWAAEAGAVAPPLSLDEARNFAGASHGIRSQGKPADRWPSMAIVIGIHLLVGWMIVHATMGAMKPKAEESVMVTIAEEQAQPTPPAPPQPPLPQLPRVEQMFAPPPDINISPIQVAVAPPPAPAESAPPPAPPAAAAPRAPADPALTPPRFDAALKENPAVYPNMSRRLREVGTVQLRVRVGADGLPLEIQLAASSRYARLDEAARDAVKKWRFQPAMRGGTAIEAWVLVPVEFSLTHS